MTKILRKCNTIKELKKDKLFKKDDLEMVVAYRAYEWINPDYLPKGKRVRFEDVNYVMKDSKNNYYLLCVVRNKDNDIRERPYYEASYIVAKIDFLNIYVEGAGNWTDEIELMMASYEYYVPKYKGKHKVVFDHKCENKIKSNFFTIEKFTPTSVHCPVDIGSNSNLTNKVDGREITASDVLGIVVEHQLCPVFCVTFHYLYKAFSTLPYSQFPPIPSFILEM